MLHSPFDTFIKCTKIEEYLKSKSNSSLKGTVLTVNVFDSELAKVLKDDKKLTGIIVTEKDTYYNLNLSSI